MPRRARHPEEAIVVAGETVLLTRVIVEQGQEGSAARRAYAAAPTVVVLQLRRRQRRLSARDVGVLAPSAFALGLLAAADGHVPERAAVGPVPAAGPAIVPRLQLAVVVIVAELGVGGLAPRATQRRSRSPYALLLPFHLCVSFTAYIQ